jgi:hypothetical protein
MGSPFDFHLSSPLPFGHAFFTMSDTSTKKKEKKKKKDGAKENHDEEGVDLQLVLFKKALKMHSKSKPIQKPSLPPSTIPVPKNVADDKKKKKEEEVATKLTPEIGQRVKWVWDGEVHTGQIIKRRTDGL